MRIACWCLLMLLLGVFACQDTSIGHITSSAATGIDDGQDSQIKDGYPIIVFTTDDAHVTIINHGFPVFKEYGFPTTTFINTGWLGHTNYMTWPQIETLRDAGWEIAGHNLLHVNLSTLSDSLLNYQIATDFQNLTTHGCNPVSFALPNGNGGPREYDVISRYYKNIRNSNDAHMTYGWDRKRLGYFPAKTVLSADDLINRIKAGQRRREAIVIIGFHRFMDDPGDYTHNCPVDSLRKVLSYVKDNGFRVMTLREAAEEIGSP